MPINRYYEVHCDYNRQGCVWYSGTNSLRSRAIRDARQAGWSIVKGKWACPECKAQLKAEDADK